MQKNDFLKSMQHVNFEPTCTCQKVVPPELLLSLQSCACGSESVVGGPRSHKCTPATSRPLAEVHLRNYTCENTLANIHWRKYSCENTLAKIHFLPSMVCSCGSSCACDFGKSFAPSTFLQWFVRAVLRALQVRGPIGGRYSNFLLKFI